MRSSKAPHEGFECCLGPRLLNPVEGWVVNLADPLNTRGLKKLAELTGAQVRWGDTISLCFFGSVSEPFSHPLSLEEAQGKASAQRETTERGERTALPLPSSHLSLPPRCLPTDLA